MPDSITLPEKEKPPEGGLERCIFNRWRWWWHPAERPSGWGCGQAVAGGGGVHGVSPARGRGWG